MEKGGGDQDMSKRMLHSLGKIVHDGWFVEGDEQSNTSRRALLKHNAMANIIANLIGGNFLTGLLLLMQADDAFIGIIPMLTFAGNLMQLLSPYILERFARRKPILIAVRATMHAINVVFIALIPLMPAATHTRLMLLAASVLTVNILNAFLNPGMSIWHIAHIPPRVRVQFFSTMHLLIGVAIALFNLVGSFVVDTFKTQGQELLGLEILRVIALAIAVYDIINLTRIKELPYAQTGKRISLRELLVKPFHNKIYMRTVLVIFIWSLFANMPGSFYTVYLLKEQHVSYSYINTVAMFNVVVLILMTPVWRRIYTKHSWLKPLSFAMMLLSLHYLLLAFASGDLLFLYPIGMIINYLCVSGINLAFSSVGYINIPEDNQTMYISFYATANNLAALAAATISRTFVSGLGGLRFHIFGVPFGEKQLLMLMLCFLMLGGGFAVRYIFKKNKGQGFQF